MILRPLAVGPLDVNCYIIGDEKSKQAACIDPGGNASEILGILEQEKLSLKYIVNTHAHFDHVGGNGRLKKATGARLAIHEKDALLLRGVASQGAVFGLGTVSSPEPDMLLKDGDKIIVDNIILNVIHTPGHTPGGVCIIISDLKLKMLFTGDTLFAGSIGRTDLPGGSYRDIISSIKDKILPLGDEVRVFPGHGPETTVGHERKFNQFLI